MLNVASWRGQMDMHVLSGVAIAAAAQPALAASRRGGVLLCVSSICGQMPIPGFAAYCAAKAAQDMVRAGLGVGPGGLGTGVGSGARGWDQGMGRGDGMGGCAEGMVHGHRVSPASRSRTGIGVWQSANGSFRAP